MINSSEQLFGLALAKTKTSVVTTSIGDIRVREMRTDELIEYRHLQSQAFDTAGVDMSDVESSTNTQMSSLQIESHAVGAWLISVCATNDTGEPLFSEPDIQQIKSLPSEIITDLNKEILEISGLSQDSDEPPVESEKKG